MMKIINNQIDKETLEKQDDVVTRILPCRGCTRSCANYERCGGKPWRLKNRS